MSGDHEPSQKRLYIGGQIVANKSLFFADFFENRPIPPP